MSGGKSIRYLPQVADEDAENAETTQPAVSMSAKPLKINLPKDENYPTEVKPLPEDEITQFEATLRGLGAGAFNIPNNVIAAFESIGSSETFSEKLKKQHAREEKVSKEFPITYYGAAAVSGAATTLVPVLGPIARTKQVMTAANALKAAKQLNNPAAVAIARRTLTSELAKSGAATGALAGLGASDKESILDTAADTLTGTVTGAATSVAVPKAIEKVGDVGAQVIESSPRLKTAAKSIGEGIESAKGAIKKVWEGERWQVPEFAGRPDKQRRVDEIVKKGQELNLTDRQILNNIAVEFKELSTKTLEDIFQEKGITGAFKRAIAGSQEAAEFIDRPEQLRRAEEASKGTTSTVARQAADIESTEAAISGKQAAKTELSRESQDLTSKLSQKRQDLQKQWETADATRRQAINAELKKLDNSESRLSNIIEQRKKVIEQYEQADKDIEQTVKNELKKAADTRTEESLQRVAKIDAELDELVKELGRQRQTIIDDLMDTQATESELEGAFNIKRNLQQTFDGEGFGKEGRQALDSAFGGDERFARVQKFFRIKDEQRVFDINQANMDWNKKNGFWDEATWEVKPGGRSAVPMKPEARPEMNPDEIPSVGELVGALFAANKKVSSAAFGTPLATVKREVGKTIQEGMKDLNLESYAIQRHLNRVKVQLETLRASPLFEARKLPVVGETGRIATVTKRIIKTEIPKDVMKWNNEYRNEMANILKGEPTTMREIVSMRGKAKEGLQQKPSPRIEQLKGEVANIEKQIKNLTTERQSLLEQQRAVETGTKLARSEEKRAVLGETVKSKLQIRNRLRQIDDQMLKLNKQLSEQGKRKAQIGETESQLVRTLQDTEGISPTTRDIGQAAVIGAKQQIPYSIGKIILPSAKQRIETVNKVKNRFSNPALTSAVRVALERPITTEVIQSLAQTHNVPEEQLSDAIQMKAMPLEIEGSPVDTQSSEPDVTLKLIDGVKSSFAKKIFMKEYQEIMKDTDERLKRIKLEQLKKDVFEDLSGYSE